MKYAKNEMLAMYRTMLVSRIFDEELIRENAKGHLQSMFHFSINEEAVCAAICHALRPDEPFMPTHRARALHLLRIPMREYLAECVGLKSGFAGGVCCDFHILDTAAGFVANPGVLGAGSPVAAGFAFALKTKHPGKAMIQMMGDGTFNAGGVHEALNWSVLMKLPIVYVCDNNHWQMSAPSNTYRIGENIADRARACGMDAVVVDGQDVLAVREALDIAMERARTKSMPSFVEAMTYRVTGHFNGDPAFYRDEEQHGEMVKNYPDPIKKFEGTLLENEIATQAELDAICAEVSKEIKDTVQSVYEESLKPDSRPTRDDIVGHPELNWATVMEGLV